MGSVWEIFFFFFKWAWHSHFEGIKAIGTKVLGPGQWSLSIRLGKANTNECFPEEDGTWWGRENEAKGMKDNGSDTDSVRGPLGARVLAPALPWQRLTAQRPAPGSPGTNDQNSQGKVMFQSRRSPLNARTDIPLGCQNMDRIINGRTSLEALYGTSIEKAKTGRPKPHSRF